jgi:hypothetical protein
VVAAERPAWHWDEQAALRAELADQAEATAVVTAALRAELARLEREKAELEESRAFWQGRAEAAEERARLVTVALSRLLRRL